jgi:outer membrane protein assembly factor BamB
MDVMKIKSLMFSVLILQITGCSSDSWFGLEKKIALEGQRIPVAEKSKDLELSSKSSQPVILPDPVKHYTWNNENIDSSNSNLLVGNIDMNKPSGGFNFSSNRDLINSSLPIIVANILYVSDSSGTLSAYNFTTGDKIWSNSNIIKKDSSGIFDFFSDKFAGGGLKHHAGKIFVTSGLSSVSCLDAKTGEILWTTELSSPTRSIPSIYAETQPILFIETIDNKTLALDVSDGKIIWSHFGAASEINILNSPALLMRNDKLIVKHGTDELYGLDAKTGDEIWAASILAKEGFVNIGNELINFSAHPVLDRDYVFSTNSNGVIAKINALNGDIVWKKDFKLSGDLWICGDYIFAISQNNNLIAVDKNTSDIVWIKDINEYDVKSGNKLKNLHYTDPIVINSKLFLVSDNGKGLFIDPKDGNILGSIEVEKNIYAKPIVAANSEYPDLLNSKDIEISNKSLDAVNLVLLSNSGKIIKY